MSCNWVKRWEFSSGRGPSWEELCTAHYGLEHKDECPGYRCRVCGFPLSRSLEYSENECPGPSHKLIVMAQRVSRGEPAHG